MKVSSQFTTIMEKDITPGVLLTCWRWSIDENSNPISNQILIINVTRERDVLLAEVFLQDNNIPCMIPVSWFGAVFDGKPLYKLYK